MTVLSASGIGLPQVIFDTLKNVVFSRQFEQCSVQAPGHGALELTKLEIKRIAAGVTTITKEVVLREVKWYKPGIRENVGAYGLNLAANFFHEWNHEEVVEIENGIELRKGDQLARFWKEGTEWRFQQFKADKSIMLVDPYTKVARYYTEAELLAMKFYRRGSTKATTLTSAMLDGYMQNYRIGYERDPSKYVCNIFSTITKTSPNNFKATIFVNGVDSDSINEQILITSFGKIGMGFGQVRWKMLNECVPGDAGSASSTVSLNEYGNAGTCGKASSGLAADALTIKTTAGGAFSFVNQKPYEVTYNSNKKFTLWFQAETFQAQGKNESTDCYYNVVEDKPVFSLFG